MIDKIERVGKTPARVLITGENGTGKELVARAIHSQSTRADGPFVEVNCAAIPSELIESELFGHMKGSFTGAVADRAGQVRAGARRHALPRRSRRHEPRARRRKCCACCRTASSRASAASKPIEVDVRVLAATNKNLETEIAEGRFREDLFYRLNVVPIHVPPLRERREDIPLLVAHFVERAHEPRGRRAARRSRPRRSSGSRSSSGRATCASCATRLSVCSFSSSGPRITGDDVARLVGKRDPEQAGLGSLLECKTFEEFKHAAERAFLLAKLREFDWNVSETARALDMPRSNLYKKIERYGLTRETVS